MGKRFIRPMLTEMKAIREIRSYSPWEAADLAIWAIAIGPPIWLASAWCETIRHRPVSDKSTILQHWTAATRGARISATGIKTVFCRGFFRVIDPDTRGSDMRTVDVPCCRSSPASHAA